MQIRRILSYILPALAGVLILVALLCLPRADGPDPSETDPPAGPALWLVQYHVGDTLSRDAAERIAALVALDGVRTVELAATPAGGYPAKPPQTPTITVGLIRDTDTRARLGEIGFMLEPTENCLHVIAFGEAGMTAAIDRLVAALDTLHEGTPSPDRIPRAFLAADGTSSDELYATKLPLTFDETGTFRVLLFSDLSAGIAVSPYTVQAIEKITAAEKPDLVLFCGGSADGFTTRAALTEFLGAVTAPLEAAGIPWAHLYAGEDSLPRAEKDEIFASFAHCVSKKGDYLLPIFHEGKPAFGIWMMSLPETGGDYTAEAMRSFADRAVLLQGRSDFPAILALAAPLYEFSAAADFASAGELNETVSAPEENNGFFSIAAAAGVRAVYAGRDHLNSYTAEHLGVELGALASLGYDGYGFGGTFDTNHRLRGGRLVELHADGSFTSTMIFAADYGVER